MLVTKCSLCSYPILPEDPFCHRCGKATELVFLSLYRVPTPKYLLEKLAGATPETSLNLFDWALFRASQNMDFLAALESAKEISPVVKETLLPAPQENTEDSNPIPPRLSESRDEEEEPKEEEGYLEIQLEGTTSIQLGSAHRPKVHSDGTKHEQDDMDYFSLEGKLSFGEEGEAETNQGAETTPTAEHSDSPAESAQGEVVATQSSATDNASASVPAQTIPTETVSDKAASPAAAVLVPVPEAAKEPVADSAKKPSSARVSLSSADAVAAAMKKTTFVSQRRTRAAEVTSLPIQTIEDYPEKFDYLLFDDNHDLEEKGYQVLGRCQEKSYDFLVFPSPDLSLPVILKTLTDTEQNDLRQWLPAAKFWECVRKLRKHFPTIRFQQAQYLLTQFADHCHIKLSQKILLNLPKVSSLERKGIIKALQQGKTLEAIYAWRKLTKLGLPESREQIEYLCESKHIPFYPTQIQATPSRWDKFRQQLKLKKPELSWKWNLVLALLLVAVLVWLGIKIFG